MGDLSPLAYVLIVTALLLGYAAGRMQEVVIEWCREILGMAVSGLTYVLMVAGVAGTVYGVLHWGFHAV
jgi:hypothetical protein